MTKPNYSELITRKKQKALSEPLSVDLAATIRITKKESDDFLMIEGIQVKKDNASFFGMLEASTVSKKPVKKVFLNKELNFAEHQFGSEMARILSAKRYAVRRQLLVKKDEMQSLHGAIKWSEAIAQPNANFLRGVEVVKESENPDFRKKYARLCGVLHVLGERDPNFRNFFLDYGQKKPVKIDNSFLVNDLFVRQYRQADAGLDVGGFTKHQRFRIYGCAQSQQMILNRFAGGKFDEKYFSKLYEESYKAALDLARSDAKDINFKQYNQIFNDAFANGINDDVLQKIREHILKPGNENIKAEFIEFMQGVQDAIDLSKDEKFLDQYVEKYRTEIGEDAFKIAQVTRGFLVENARLMENFQLRGFLEFYCELAQEKSAAVVPDAPSEAASKERVRRKLPPTPSSSAQLPKPDPATPRVRRMLPQIKGKEPLGNLA